MSRALGTMRMWSQLKVLSSMHKLHFGVTERARVTGALVIFIQHEANGGYLEYGTDAWQLANGLKVVAGYRTSQCNAHQYI
jgi:hypothetical protein